MAYFDCIVGGSDGSTLTVTCYSGFAGLTISITNGTDTFSDVCPSTSPYEVVFEGLANGTWTLSTVYNGVTYTETVEVNLTSRFYPIPNGATATPINNIQTWLHCADIWDKNYTTIGQVLADASTLQALIASNNAVDYMARSTSWASSVTANANAMTYIGANNYCANKLLTNSTWCNAICKSTYFENVLNVKVPTMTSTTTPSGEVIFSSQYSGQEAWRAFDGDGTDLASTATPESGYFGYKFTSSIKLNRIDYTWYSNYAQTFTFNVQGSNTGATNDWHNVATNISCAAPSADKEVKTFAFTNSTPYKYWRMKYNTASSTSGYSQARELQFYGRA